MSFNEILYNVTKPIDKWMSRRNGGIMLNVGDEAPDFNVLSHQGEPVKLKDFQGRKLVLWFYPKADTPGCTAEGCSFRDLNKEFADKGIAVLGVSFDTVEENRGFAEKFSFTFPLLCDTERKLGLAYGACQTAEDKNASRIAYVIDGNGKIEKVYAQVDAKNFPTQLLGEY